MGFIVQQKTCRVLFHLLTKSSTRINVSFPEGAFYVMHCTRAIWTLFWCFHRKILSVRQGYTILFLIANIFSYSHNKSHYLVSNSLFKLRFEVSIELFLVFSQSIMLVMLLNCIRNVNTFKINVICLNTKKGFSVYLPMSLLEQ